MIVRSPYQATPERTPQGQWQWLHTRIELELGYDWDSEWKSNLSFPDGAKFEQLEEDAFGSQMKLVDHDNDESTAKFETI